MDLKYNPEERKFRAEVRAFFDAELPTDIRTKLQLPDLGCLLQRIERPHSIGCKAGAWAGDRDQMLHSRCRRARRLRQLRQRIAFFLLPLNGQKLFLVPNLRFERGLLFVESLFQGFFMLFGGF